MELMWHPLEEDLVGKMSMVGKMWLCDLLSSLDLAKLQSQCRGGMSGALDLDARDG